MPWQSNGREWQWHRESIGRVNPYSRVRQTSAAAPILDSWKWNLGKNSLARGTTSRLNTLCLTHGSV
jgi:hypothetical protein